ncbi:Cuticle protein, partial [Homarus americanus]
ISVGRTTFTYSLPQPSLRPALFSQTGGQGSVWGYIRKLLHQPDIIVLDASPHTRHEARELPDNEGGFQEVRYVANEFGVQAQSPLLPTPHPLPAHAQELIRIAEELRSQGVVFDQNGFRVNRK